MDYLPNASFVKQADQRIDLTKNTKLILEESAGDVNFRRYSATTASISNINFTNVNPSGPDVILDKKVYVSCFFELQFTRVGAPIVPGSAPLLQIGYNDAPRFMPLNSSIETTQIQLNGTSQSFSTNRYIEPLMRYSNYRDFSMRDLSGTYSQQDTMSEYHFALAPPVPGSLNNASAYGSAGNVLGQNWSNGYIAGRGGHPDCVKTFDDGNAATVTVYTIEPLVISPLGWGHSDKRGFYGLNTFQVQLTITSAPELSIWSRSKLSEPYVCRLSSINQAEIMFQELRPKSLEGLPLRNIYPFSRITSNPNSGPALASGASTTVVINNLQLQAIPRLIYIFARQIKNTRDISSTDTYAAIKSLNLTWGGKTLLSQCNQYQLFNIASRNGYLGSYQDWVKYTGGVMCINFGKDISLPEGHYVGLEGTYQYVIQVEIENPRPFGATDGNGVLLPPILYELDSIVVQDGYMEIADGMVHYSDNLLSPGQLASLDVKSIHSQDPYFHEEFTGGSIVEKAVALYEKLKGPAQKVAELIKVGTPYAIAAAAKLAPILLAAGPYEEFLKKVVKELPRDRAEMLMSGGYAHYGLRGSGVVGGGVVGGGVVGGGVVGGKVLAKKGRLIDQYRK